MPGCTARFTLPCFASPRRKDHPAAKLPEADGPGFPEARWPCQAKQYKRARRVLKNLKTMAGRVFRDVERKMSDTAFEAHKGTMLLAEQVLTQKRFTKGKIYSLHAPEVECIAKGKAHKPYEFGVKVSVAVTHKEGFVVGIQAFPDNPYDGHTLMVSWTRWNDSPERCRTSPSWIAVTRATVWRRNAVGS